MNKKITALLGGVLSVAGSVFAQSSSTIIDTTQLATDANTVKTELTTFLTGTMGPVVLGIAGAGMIVWLTIKLFRWARRAAS